MNFSTASPVTNFASECPSEWSLGSKKNKESIPEFLSTCTSTETHLLQTVQGAGIFCYSV